jgi:hypothetical protein
MPDVDELPRGARDAIAAERVYAEPVEGDGVTVIPAAVVLGGGGGEEAPTRTAAPGSASWPGLWAPT